MWLQVAAMWQLLEVLRLGLLSLCAWRFVFLLESVRFPDEPPHALLLEKVLLLLLQIFQLLLPEAALNLFLLQLPLPMLLENVQLLLFLVQLFPLL